MCRYTHFIAIPSQMEIDMNTFSRAITTSTQTLLAAALLVLTGAASAANSGSTDPWSNQFKEFYGDASGSSDAPRSTAQGIGSTDLWSNQFRASFREGQQGTSAKTVSLTGSTDLWANGFRASFATPAYATPEPVGLREDASSAVR
jgi:hypothetical protein